MYCIYIYRVKNRPRSQPGAQNTEIVDLQISRLNETNQTNHGINIVQVHTLGEQTNDSMSGAKQEP